ncbi:hypothetical protein [Microbacterium sp. K27]|uniref:hypothetical protein n=1 Tax=Microbacterium sp. K27 TaxID=2305445 RepID=UPI00109BC789|nr:hypothetical protein [Microbacterium sp. K27]
MTFWDTFWATMWGALAGGGFGAFTAWLFALELRRRETRARAEEFALRQSATMRAEWADLANHTSLYRAWLLARASRHPVVRMQQRKALFDAEQGLHDRIVLAASTASGPDATLVNLIGAASMATFIGREAKAELLDEVTQMLLHLATTDPVKLSEVRRSAIESIRARLDAQR